MAQHHEHDHPGLDVQVERTAPCLATVRFTVTSAEYQKARKIGLSNYARRTRIKGFRPGKVPAAYVERHFGEEVDKQLVEHFVQHAFQHAVDDEGLRPAVMPRIDLEKVAASNDSDWSHEFEVLLRPEVELGEVKGIVVEGRAVGVTPQELEDAREGIRRELSTPEPAGEEGLQADGMAVCELTFLREGSSEPVLERDGIRLNPRTSPVGIAPDLFEQEMTGLRVGQQRSFEITFPQDFPTADARGEKGTLLIRAAECFRIVPPEDARVYSEFDVQDEEGLRAEIERRVMAVKRDQENQRIEQVLLEKLLQQHPVELPGPLVEDQARSKVAELRQVLESQGHDQAEVEKRLEEEHRVALENAGQAMRAIYLMEEIARRHGLQIEKQDLEAEFAAIAVRNGVQPAEVRKYYQQENLLQQLALELLERKVRSFLRESADIQVAGASD